MADAADLLDLGHVGLTVPRRHLEDRGQETQSLVLFAVFEELPKIRVEIDSRRAFLEGHFGDRLGFVAADAPVFDQGPGHGFDLPALDHPVEMNHVSQNGGAHAEVSEFFSFGGNPMLRPRFPHAGAEALFEVAMRTVDLSEESQLLLERCGDGALELVEQGSRGTHGGLSEDRLENFLERFQFRVVVGKTASERLQCAACDFGVPRILELVSEIRAEGLEIPEPLGVVELGGERSPLFGVPLGQPEEKVFQRAALLFVEGAVRIGRSREDAAKGQVEARRFHHSRSGAWSGSSDGVASLDPRCEDDDHGSKSKARGLGAHVQVLMFDTWRNSAVVLAIWTLALGAAACSAGDPLLVEPGTVLLAEGIELRRYPLEAGKEPSLVTGLYIDPARYELRLLTAQDHGPPRTVRQWCMDFDLIAGINASMYLPNLRSTGWMVVEDRVNNGALNPALGGVLAFSPRTEGLAPLAFFSTECEDSVVERASRDYRSIIQNYRLLGCEREAIGWKDPKSYSSAAVGLDERGWVVFVHSGAPCRTIQLARCLADDRWGLVAAHFVEGGPDATLFSRAGAQELEIVGSYAGLQPTPPRPVPNVLGVARPPNPR